MREFESMIIVKPSFSEQEAGLENEKVLNFIKEQGGEISETDTWGKRDLAYEINKIKEGYYFINYFKMDPSKTSALTQFYRLNEAIIRHNLLNKE